MQENYHINKFWQQELDVHPTNQASLSNDELLAIMGSWTEEKIENTSEDFSGRQKDTMMAVLQEALSELSSIAFEDGDIRSALAGRLKELESELQKADAPSSAVNVRIKIAGLDHLARELGAIEDNIRLAGKRKGGKPITDRTEYVNHLIEEHNRWVARSMGVFTFEQDEVEDAARRQASSGATDFAAPHDGDTGKTEGSSRDSVLELRRRELLSMIVGASKGTACIYTDIPSGSSLASRTGNFEPTSGFNSFGDGLLPKSDFYRRRLRDDNCIEALLFDIDLLADNVTSVSGVRGEALGGAFDYPGSSVEEQLVRVAYQFNGNTVGGARYEGPVYVTDSGRAGNMLSVEVLLPESMASELRSFALQQPLIVREFARSIAIYNGGLSEDLWERIVRPPYDKLPDDWEIAVINKQGSY